MSALLDYRSQELFETRVRKYKRQNLWGKYRKHSPYFEAELDELSFDYQKNNSLGLATKLATTLDHQYV